MSNLRNRRGQSLLTFLLILPLLMGSMGLAVDFGWAFFRQESAKTAAQAAALASVAVAGTLSSGSPVCGATNVVCQSATRCPDTIPSPAVTNIDVACQYAQYNGFANKSGGSQNVMVASGTGTPTGMSGVTSVYWVEVTTAESIPQTFSAVFGSKYGGASATATAGYLSPAGGCVYVLGTGSSVDVNMSGTASLSTACGVYVNATTSNAINISESASITVTGGQSVFDAGGINESGSARVTPLLQNQTAVANPLSSLTAPTSSGCSISGVSLSGSSTQTIGPCTTGGVVTVTSTISLSGTSALTMNPGVYIINGGISLSGGTSISATGGVMLYVPNGTISLSAGAIVNLTAPSSGAYEGIAIYQPSTNSSAVSLSGGTTQSINGAIYVPGAALNFSGGASTSALSSTIVCAQIDFSGNSYIRQPATTLYSGTSGATLLQ